MKRFTLILAVLFVIMALGACVSPGAPGVTEDARVVAHPMVDGRIQYQVPRAQGSVTIDGTIDESQWANALVIQANHQDFVVDGIGSSIWNINMGMDTPSQAPRASAVVRVLWSDAGLYLAAEVTDPTPTNFQPFGGQSNIQDAVQFTFDPDFQRGAAALTDVYIMDLSMSSAGETYWYEYFQYGGFDPSAGVVTAGGPTATGWVVEAFVPWDFLRAAGETFVPAPGLEMGFGILMCDFAEQGTLNDLFWDFGNMVNTIDQPGTWNSIVLGN